MKHRSGRWRSSKEEERKKFTIKLIKRAQELMMGIEITGEESLALQLWPCGYRVKCSAPGCANLARIIVRRVAHGKFDGQDEYCNKDLRGVIEAAKARGVAVDDMRL